MASQLIFSENASSPDTPSTGKLKLYAKNDGFLYFKNDAGTEIQISSTANISSLTGDVTATGPGAAAATVVTVGGALAADIATATALANAATNNNTPSTIVLRDASGNFSAGIITGTLSGSATNFSGSLSGDVTGTQSATVVGTSAVTSKLLTGLSSVAGVITSSDSILSAIGKLDGNDGLRALKSGDTFTGNIILDNQQSVRFREDSANGTEFVGIRAPDALAASYSVKLPNSQAAGALTNDGSGNLSWQTASLAGFDTDDLPEGTTNLYFTAERAQDAVGNILTDSSKIDFTYNDAGNTITATIVTGSLADVDVSSSAAITLSKLAALTASRALVSDGAGVISPSAVTSIELGYVSGVTSPIQTQLGNTQPLDADLTALAALSTTGLVVRTGSGTVTTRTLQAGTGISISNVDGVAGDPSISSTITQYTDEQAQDAVGSMLLDTTTVELIYVDGVPSLTANVRPLSLTNSEISTIAAISYSKLNLASSIVTGDLASSIYGTPSTQLPDQSNASGVATTLARSDHTHNIPSGSVVQIGTSNFAGAAASFALSDHVHAHGNQTVGTLHAAATTSVNGFMSSTDKTLLDTNTASNTPSSLVLRNPSGNFSAGTITASLTGAASDNLLKAGDTMTGYFRTATVALVDGPTINTDASLGNMFTVTLGGNRTLAAPTNPLANQRIIYRITQDATGGRTLSFDSVFNFGIDLSLVSLSPGANATDYVGCVYNGATSRWDVIAISRSY